MDNAGGFVAKNHGLFDDKVAYSAFSPVVNLVGFISSFRFEIVVAQRYWV